MISFLQKFFKYFLVLIMATIFMLVVSASFYDVFYFQPYLSGVRQIYEEGHSEDKNPPDSIKTFLKADLNSNVSAYAARLLIIKLNVQKPEDGQFQWHIKNILWSAFVVLHIPQQEIYGLICILSYNGKGVGANALSERVFSKPLNSLTVFEAASLVAILNSPKRYLNSPSDRIKRRDMLLQRVEASKKDQ